MTEINHKQYTKRDRLATVGRRLYPTFHDVRRPDGSRLWKDANALANVIGRGISEGQLEFYARGSAKYIKEEDAVPFLEDYISTRINSNGMSRSTIQEISQPEPELSLVDFGFLGNRMGMPVIFEQLRTITDITVRVHEQLEELNEHWKPSSLRDDNESGQT
jgi:hypothetical protein